MTNEIEWEGPSLSDRVAEQIVAFRKRPSMPMNREQLAQRCAELGAPGLTFAALTNIEGGRKKDGKRRRDITIDELVIIARALEVPPILLMFPVGKLDKVEVIPGVFLSPWYGYEWFVGRHFVDTPDEAAQGERERMDFEERLRRGEDPPRLTDEDLELDPWEITAAPITLLDRHYDLVGQWLNLATDIHFVAAEVGSEVEELERAWASFQRPRIEQELRLLREEMRRHGITPPDFSPDHPLADIDRRSRRPGGKS